MKSAAIVRVQAQRIDLRELAALADGRTDMGALVTFTGLCRDEGGRLAALEIEHYPGMAEGQIRRVADETMARWPLGGLVAVHRHGRIAPGEEIVAVAAASAHRRVAFEAASFLMDYLKTSAPFWKKEIFKDGREGGWVAAKEADDEAAARWSVP